MLQSARLLDGSRLLSPGYLQTDNTTYVKDTSKGDPAGVILQLRGLWSSFGQAFLTPQDWSAYNTLSVKIENLDASPTRIVVRVQSGQDLGGREQQLLVIPPRQTVHLTYDLDLSGVVAQGLKALPPVFDPAPVRFWPTVNPNLRDISGWQVYSRQETPANVRIWDFKLLKVDPNAGSTIDAYGQSAFGSWIGKVSSPSDFVAQTQAEDSDLLLNPGPGELRGSTTLPATSPSTKWRTLRLPSGKWYLVHPSGRLFWSMGVTSVTATNPTVVSQRETLFQQLPDRGTSATHYGTLNPQRQTSQTVGFTGPNLQQSVGATWRERMATPARRRPDSRGYNPVSSQGQTLETVNFTGLNLERKYGATWRESFATQALRRLDSWGYNTVGDWSDPSVLARSEMPFVIGVSTNGSAWRLPVPISSRTLPDPFDRNFPTWFAGRLAQAIQPYNGRPEFMGVFVDVELPWGQMSTARTRYAVALAALGATNDQPAKRAFVSLLRRKYSSISRLNRSWGTRFASWGAIDDPGEDLRPSALADCRMFVRSFALQYYRSVSSAFASTNASALYLGSREGWQTTPEVWESATKCVDVFSVNIYQRAELVDWNFTGIDKPIVIGEFSFGATDRGMWHGGPRVTTSQADRAERMRDFYNAALSSPKIVGAHWFQYVDQPVSGRYDGENYNVGLVTVTDTPHPEMRAVTRVVGANLYLTRGN